MMSDENLINRLCADLVPVKPLPRPAVFALIPALASLVAVAVCVALFSVRGNLFAAVRLPEFWVDSAGSLILFILAVSALGTMSFPGLKQRLWLVSALAGLTAAKLVWFIGQSLGLGPDETRAGLDPVGWKCFAMAASFAALTALVGFYWFRKGATPRPAVSGLLLGLAAISLGAAGVNMHCPSLNSLHIAIMHFTAPLLVGLAAGTFAGRRAFHW
jgi:hypothetical protein